MTKLATMGTSSCATIAIQGFKKSDYDMEMLYQKTGQLPHSIKGGNDALWFYNEILYPVAQVLGRTDDFPFSHLMKSIDAQKMGTKFTIVTLNIHQLQQENYFWPHLLKKWGFKLSHATKNSIGGTPNFIFIRNKKELNLNEFNIPEELL